MNKEFDSYKIVDQAGLYSVQKDLSSKYCKNFYTRLEVGLDGSVWMCCPHWLPPVIGNLFEEELEDIWNGPKAQVLRNQMFDGKWGLCQQKICPMIVDDKLPNKSDIADMPYINKWEIEGVKNKSLTPYPYPVDIMFGTDKSCNLKCPSCRMDKIQLIEGFEYEKCKYLTDKLMAGILRIDPMQTVDIWVTGSGDPFGSKIYREMLQNINGKEHPNLRINLTTNGVMFTPKIYESLHKIHDNLAICVVSLDAGTKHTYENVTRLGGHWDTLLKNLDFLHTKIVDRSDPNWFMFRNNSVEGFRLGFSFVVTSTNYKEMPEYIRLTRERYPNSTRTAFSLILDWNTWTPPEYEKQCIWKTSHPEHEEFLEVLRNPIFKQEYVFLGNLKSLYDLANA